MRRRLLLLDAIVKAGCMYGVEIWGWKRWEGLEREQGKYVKRAIGVNTNTPSYIWMMETGRASLEIESRRRAGDYLGKIAEMGDDRWPTICLKEEMRGIGNGYPTEWGKGVKIALEETGDGKSIKEIGKEDKKEEVEEWMGMGRKIKMEQEIQGNWGKIDRSGFCPRYKEIKEELGEEKYWEDRNGTGV